MGLSALIFLSRSVKPELVTPGFLFLSNLPPLFRCKPLGSPFSSGVPYAGLFEEKAALRERGSGKV